MQVIAGEDLAELIRHLKLKWQHLNTAYVRLPCVLDTPSKRRRKEVRGQGRRREPGAGWRRLQLQLRYAMPSSCSERSAPLPRPRCRRSWRGSWQKSSATCACSARPRPCASASSFSDHGCLLGTAWTLKAQGRRREELNAVLCVKCGCYMQSQHR